MIIAQLTDTHILDLESDDSDRALQRYNDLKACIDDINREKPQPDIVVHTGDISQSGKRSEYELVQDLTQKLQIPFYFVPGNRDSKRLLIETIDSKTYPYKHNDQPILFDITSFPVRLIGIDSLATDDGRGDFCENRLQRLAWKLQENQNLPTAIFMHHPPITIETQTTTFLEFVSKMKADSFLALISDFPQIKRVFCGHSHRPYVKFHGKIEISTAPCVASDLRKGFYPITLKNKPIYQIHIFDKTYGFTSQTRLPVNYSDCANFRSFKH